MSRQYEALVEVTVRDTDLMKPLPSVRLNVKFDAPEDPRSTLTRAALEQAVEQAVISEGMLWL
jgi:hypothetical protein